VKTLTWKLILPLTVISFMTFTKWWHVEIDDTIEILRGFPFPFVCPGWHTSLSLQIFVLEFIADFLIYFLFWFLLMLVITRISKPIRVPKFVTLVLFVISGLFTVVLVLFAVNPDNIYTTTRNFDIKIMETGYRFIWQKPTRPDYTKFHRDIKNEQ
jgi:hypothetical protein